MKRERAIVLEILLERTEQRFFKTVYLQKMADYPELNGQQRAFIKRLAQGTLEREYTLDKVLRHYSKLRLKKLSPAVHGILRLSLYQLLYMDKVPAYSVVHEAVELAKERREFRAVSFINALLRRVAENPKVAIEYVESLYRQGDWQSFYSFPQEVIDLLLESYAPAIVQRILSDSLMEKPLSLRLIATNVAEQAEIDAFLRERADRLRGEGVLFPQVRKYNGSMEDETVFQKGYIQVQDESSMLVGYLAAKEMPKRIYDLCAAPGGKSVHLAGLLPDAKLIASDLSEQKVEKIRENIRRLRLKNMEVTVQDAAQADARKQEKADCVLADVPCSGLGVIAGKPDIKYRLTRQAVAELSRIQAKILEQAAQYVAVGGVLLYSTCTLLPEENQEQIHRFLKDHTEFSLCDISSDELFQTLGAQRLMADGKLIWQQGMLQILPGELQGFFIAKLRRIR